MTNCKISTRNRQWIQRTLLDPTTKIFWEDAVFTLAGVLKDRGTFTLYEGASFRIVEGRDASFVAYEDGQGEFVALGRIAAGQENHTASIADALKRLIVLLYNTQDAPKTLIFGL